MIRVAGSTVEAAHSRVTGAVEEVGLGRLPLQLDLDVRKAGLLLGLRRRGGGTAGSFLRRRVRLLLPLGLRRTALLSIGPLGAAADDLDLVGRDRLRAVLHLEGDPFDQEGPHLVAESVRVERALEGQARLDLLAEGLGHDAIEVVEDLHGQLRIELCLLDQLIESLNQRDAETAREK